MQLIWFCVAGYSFFIGVFVLAAVVAMSFFPGWNKYKQYWIHAAGFAAIGIFMSAMPFSLWFYAVWLVMLMLWKAGLPKSRYFGAAALVMSLVAVIWSFWPTGQIEGGKFERLYVIGDSVSAGIGNEKTWPEILQDKYGIDTVNLAVAGATAGSAIEQVSGINNLNSLVLLEIGGNDLFQTEGAGQFAHDLDKLLKEVRQTGAEMIMLELPVFPWQLRYTIAQRQLAAKYEVKLVPKRFFVSLLSAKGATSDLAHLTQDGHFLMAEKIWGLLGPYFQQGTIR